MSASPLSRERAVGVVGAGTMGTGIARVAAQAGHVVYVYDTSADAVTRAFSELGSRLDRDVEKGRLDAEEAAAIAARLRPSTDLADFAAVGLVVESIIEDEDVKRGVLTLIESVVPDDALITTNTSSLSVTALSSALDSPERLVGMHFFNPAPLLPLVEVVSGRATAPGVADACFATALAWGKTPVRCSSTPGFIVNRVARPFYAEALRLLAEGVAEVAVVDRVVEAAGRFRMGPFTLMDLVGLDVNLAVSTSVYEQTYHDPRFSPSVIQKDLVDAGRLGRKTGAGFYDYPAALDAEVPVIAPAPHSGTIEVRGDLGWAGSLIDRWRNAGVALDYAFGADHGYVAVDGAALVPTNGRSAARLQASGAFDGEVVVIDLFRPDATAVAVAARDDGALATAAGVLDAAGLSAIAVDDAPGLVLMRVVAQLASVAADAVAEGVATAADVDLAMRLGANYPAGPLSWADDIGPVALVEVLDNLFDHHREERYGAAASLRRAALDGRSIGGRGTPP